MRNALFVTLAALGSATLWAYSSRSRAGRWLRQLEADVGRSVRPAPFKPRPQEWSDNEIILAWLGHSTVLISFYGVRILTDPVLLNHVGISLGVATLGPKRYIAPALRSSEIPPLDVVLLSHGHMDHMDLRSLRALPRTGVTVTAADTRDIVAKTRRKRITELRWNEVTVIRTPKGELGIRAFEVKHWGQRWPRDRERGYNGYILSREGKQLLFGGDTARTPLFRSIRGHYEAAIMPIGAYDPWIWHHCAPEEAVDMANEARARFLVPVHHQTLRLSNEPMSEPMERFRESLAEEPERVALDSVGQTFRLPLS